MTGTPEQSRPADLPPESLRKQMVDELCEQGWITSDRVAAAFGVVPRHVFAPGEPLDRAYSVTATLLAKRNKDGRVVSTVSAPHLQALMLEQSEIEPGMRVLEIGSGGYNAALLAEVVGRDGEVTSMDIDPEVVDRARACLAGAGYERVNVVLGDAEAGAAANAPFDRVIVTAGAWDIPPAWVEQLADGGRIVVPLRVRGLTRSVVFEPDGNQLVGQGYELCSFVPFQGDGAQDDHVVTLEEDVRLRLEAGVAAAVDEDALGKVLSQPRVEAWSGLTVGSEDRFDGLQLWLALGLNTFGLLLAERAAAERGVVAHAWPLGVPATASGASLAYLGLRPVGDDGTCEFGAYGHGPEAEALVEAMVQRTQSWDRTSLSARIDAYPAGTPDDQLPADAHVFDKKHRRITITWPSLGQESGAQ